MSYILLYTRTLTGGRPLQCISTLQIKRNKICSEMFGGYGACEHWPLTDHCTSWRVPQSLKCPIQSVYQPVVHKHYTFSTKLLRNSRIRSNLSTRANCQVPRKSPRTVGEFHIDCRVVNLVSVMGGATVLKVGGGNFASGESQKKFLTPHFLASGGGDKILLR